MGKRRCVVTVMTMEADDRVDHVRLCFTWSKPADTCVRSLSLREKIRPTSTAYYILCKNGSAQKSTEHRFRKLPELSIG